MALVAVIPGERLRIVEVCMMSKLRPPSRADHVGSLLRPPAVLAARHRRAVGELDDAELRGIEDNAFAAVVPKLEATGPRHVVQVADRIWS